MPQGQPLATANDDLLEKGFRLAWFIISDRTTAIAILTSALKKLKAQHWREGRRAYWRDKNLKRGITRISRDEQDALQWLIFFEAEEHERTQERAGKPTQAQMVVRYVKTLVRATTALSSFYVNVGLHRLLHNYTTAEIQRAYETVTERFLGSDEYRRAKLVLMGKLEKRFGDALHTFRESRGELRFETEGDQPQWTTLVNECLDAFTPWSTAGACPIPRDFSQKNPRFLNPLPGKKPEEPSGDELELLRSHAFIEPACYQRLMLGLALDDPNKRLAVPRFYMQNAKSKNDESAGPPPRLTEDERRSISAQLAREATRRRHATVDSVKVVVDGDAMGTVDLRRNSALRLEIEEGAELIEIRGEHEGEEIIFGVHRPRYSEAQGFVASQATIAAGRGKKVLLRIEPAAAADQESPRRAALVLKSKGNPLAALWSASGASASVRGLGYATASLLLVGLGWMLGTSQHRRNSEVTVAPMPSNQVQPATLPRNAGETVASFRLVPDENIVRGPGGSDLPVVHLPANPAVLSLELPVLSGPGKLRATLKPFMKNAEIMAEMLPAAKQDESGSPIAVFSVPSNLLRVDQDYTLTVERRDAGRMESGTFTFHVSN